MDKITEGVRLTDGQRLDWLRLIRSDNVGPRGLRAQLHQTVEIRYMVEFDGNKRFQRKSRNFPQGRFYTP